MTLRTVVLEDSMRVREVAAFVNEMVSAGTGVTQPQQTGDAQPERAPPDAAAEPVRSLVEIDFHAF